MNRFLQSALRALMGVCAAGFLFGCTLSDALRNDPITSAQPNGGTETGTHIVAVVTDREPDASKPLGFGNHWDEQVRCATAAVTVPPQGRGTVSGTPPVPQHCTNNLSSDDVAALIDATKPPAGCHSVLLYVHGYNTIFRSALLRAGQIAADTQWPCTMAAFSWGSEGQFDRYAADIERSGYSIPLLMRFLEALQQTKTQTNIIAHSMGNRVVLSALAELGDACLARGPIIGELILAAPDVNSEENNDDFDRLSTKALPCAHRVTIYASRDDMVLMMSQSIHGGIPRAGLDPSKNRTYAAQHDDVEVIDATDAPGDPMGHGYFVSSYEMLDDIMAVLRGVPIASRVGATPATLLCANKANKPCTGPHDRYRLAVSAARRPDWTTRLERQILAHLLAIHYGVSGQMQP